ncbi:Tkl protein kinase, partial [Globisporangium splendens]
MESPPRLGLSDDGSNSPTPNASFCLLEARDSHNDIIVPAGNDDGAPAAAAGNSNTRQQRQRPQYPTRQSPPERNENDSPSFVYQPQQLNQFRMNPNAPPAYRRERMDSLHDLFPMINANVFTNPENIMPSYQDAIMIDDIHDHLSSFHNTNNNNTVNNNGTLMAQNGLAVNQLSIGAIFGGLRTAASTRDPSCQSASYNDARLSSSSHDSLSDTLRTNASFTFRTTPKQWLLSLWKRFNINWDSYFLLFTLGISIAAIPVGVVIATVLDHTRPYKNYKLRCKRTTPVRENTIASTAAVTIPTLNMLVLLVISLWVAIRCSQSRKRVLRSTAVTSARINLKLTCVLFVSRKTIASAFMLPCYEAIWYMIAFLSCCGIALYGVSYAPLALNRSDEAAAETSNLVPENDDALYPCNIATLPYVWILQLLPMLMVQRSVSQEAVVRSIVYSGAVCIVMLVLYMSLFTQNGSVAMNAISVAVHFVLLCFYFWAKFVFHARSSFDFFFVAAVIGTTSNLVIQIVDMSGGGGTDGIYIGYCVVQSIFALTTVAILLSLRADTRYWLGIDDGTSRTQSPMRQYMRQLAERGMITNFSTRTSVYDVHRMIEEHRKNVVDFSELKLDGIIAQGATSIVMRGVLRGNTDIALKIYTSVQVTDEELDRFSRETALNVQLSHPNIVKFHGLCVVPPSISLVFEFCEYGGLDVALKNSSFWGLSTKLKAWLDACKAVAYLHSFSPPLLHRDIKTDNFLLGQDYLLKLADFGEANLLRPRTDGTMTIAGTVDYMAPEMILGGKTARYGTAVDTYSLMITLWQIMVPDRSPWEGKTHLEVYTCVKDGERPPLLPSIPQGCAEILESGWCANPFERVAVDELIPKGSGTNNLRLIAIVLLLLFIGTVVPKLIWNKHNSQDIEEESGRSEHAVGLQYSDEEENADYNRTLNGSEDRWTRGEFQSASRLHGNRPSTFRRTKSGMDLVQGSRAYSLLLERYQREGWCFRFNVLKQWHLWKSFEILAYNICQNRSRYIYKNPTEMERLFGVKPKPSNPNRWLLPQGHQVEPMTYARYHVLCMRNLLFHITDLHVSALFILVVISVLPSVCPNYDHWIFIGVGGILLLVNLVIFFKVLQILRGIVDDRLRVITMRDIRVRLTKLQNSDNSNLLPKEPEAPLQTPKRLSLKGVALGVRAVIRMQMSALCHRQLHHHDDRFWFDSPQFLLRLFQFATISQAFYLVWLSLVEAPTIMQTDRGAYLLPIMVLLPLLVLCVITPMTMPSLVLVMSLTGIFVDLNSETGKQGRRESYQIAQTRIRLMRRSFLKSHHNDDTVGSCPHVSSPTHDEHQDTVSSPSNVFLRIYDSPTAAAVHSKLGADLVSPVSSPMAPRSSPRSNEDTLAVSLLQARRSSSGGSSSLGRRNRDDNGYSGARRSFNLAAFQSSATPSSVLTSLYEGPRNNNYSESQQAALPNWSQAKVDRINSTQAAVPRTTDDVAPNSSNSTDPSPSPVSEPFKSYCSKYGGYPDS